MITIHLQPHDPTQAAHSLQVQPGQSLMQAAVDANLPGIQADCGGLLTCATCHVVVHSDWLSKLPPVGSPTEIAGKVSDDVAAQTGLKAGTPVVRGVYDVVGCSLASGVQQASQLAAVAGTFSIPITDVLAKISGVSKGNALVSGTFYYSNPNI